MAATSKKRVGKAKPKAERPRNSRRPVDKRWMAALAGSGEDDAAYDLQAAQRAVDDGADVNCAIDFSTALIHALLDSKHRLIEWLLAQPAIDINQSGRHETPLAAAIMGAARTGDRRWVDRLFSLGADPSTVNEFGQSALTRCLDFFPDDVGWLERLITPKTVAPHATMERWQPIRMALLHDSPTAWSLLTERGATLADPMVEAAKAGASKCIAGMLEGDALVPEALIEASNVETARVLLEAGAGIDATDKKGYSALYNACAGCNPALVRFLLERGASQCPGARPVVFALATPSTIEIAEVLAAHGADVTVRDQYGHSVADVCREMIGVVGGSKVRGVGRFVERMRRDVADIERELRTRG